MKRLIADRGTGEPISLGAALIAGKKVPPNANELLKEDHRIVLGWFRWYEQAQDPDEKLRVADRICKALRGHMAAEEEILYPKAEALLEDDDLVQRAYDEHAEAVQIVAELEQATQADERHADLVRRLEAEIRDHVDEEENELMPTIRESGIDLYAVGGAVAARRVDELFAATRPNGPEEYPKMPISQDEARNFFVLGLKNAHAAVRQGRSLVEAQLNRVENYPRLKQKLELHLQEKDAQLTRLEDILDNYGESRSALKDAAMTTAAGVSSLAHASAEDEIVKNSFATLALAKYEAAAYETLILFGEAAGDTAALRPLQQSLSEERGMAAFVEENLRSTGMRFLQLRSEGAQASH